MPEHTTHPDPAFGFRGTALGTARMTAQGCRVMMAWSMADMHKVGLLLVRDGRVLLCRKSHTTSRLILPGGRVEFGETLLDCLTRELREELGPVQATGLVHLGQYTHRAAHDDPSVARQVTIDLYGGELSGTPMARREIHELVWFAQDDDWATLAPSLAERIFPDLIQRGLLPWSARA